MIMRDVNSGWLVRYVHANVASFFFIFVYAHIGRAIYYGSYKGPRFLPYAIGVIIFILMMAKLWPNWLYLNYIAEPSKARELLNDYTTSGLLYMLPINKARTKAIQRIGPHNKEILEIIISGMLGDFWADKIEGKQLNSIRFNIEQGINNTAYIHYLSLLIFNLGYCSKPVPTLIKKSNKYLKIQDQFNYKLTLFTFSSFSWIYDSFYKTVNGKTVKKVPFYIADYLTPLGLAHWIMQDGSFQKGQGIFIATNSFTYEECKFLANILVEKYSLKTSVIKTGTPNQWRVSVWKKSMPTLRKIVEPYIIPEMKYKLGI